MLPDLLKGVLRMRTLGQLEKAKAKAIATQTRLHNKKLTGIAAKYRSLAEERLPQVPHGID